jgi:eukaryotic-like serine/threonine-protein kinase
VANILIVDDEDVFLEFAAHALRADGHVVTMTTSPAMALDLARSELPDLVISDINMPKMSGFELATILNAAHARHWIPIVFMSSRNDGPSFREAFGVGAIDYLVKPFSREHLVSTVRRKLTETEQRRAAARSLETDAMPVIPGYKLINALGEGGMGEVYLAENVKTGLRCALKVLTIVDEGKEQTQVLARFLEERAMLSRVDHPNVAKVFDHGINDNHVYIAMEYFPCGDLKAAMARGVPVTTAFAYVRQIAEGLREVHAHGIIHRDIKPANVMLRNDGTTALVDFGIAKELDASTTFTRHGEMIGTPHYMSPEQIGSKSLDARSDLYSLGAMFYEMLTHTHAFRGDRIESILMQHLHAPRPVLPKNLSILQPLLDRLLAIEPSDRFIDAAAFLKEFSVVELMRFSDHVDAGQKSFSGMAALDTLPGA